MASGHWFFRVIEHADGHWTCRRGTEDLDAHGTRDEAVDHIWAIADRNRPAEVLAHHLDGTVCSLGVLDCSDPLPP